MIVRVCASTPLVSRTGLPAEFPIIDCPLSIVDCRNRARLSRYPAKAAEPYKLPVALPGFSAAESSETEKAVMLLMLKKLREYLSDSGFAGRGAGRCRKNTLWPERGRPPKRRKP